MENWRDRARELRAEQQTKARENTTRRWAREMGLELRKSSLRVARPEDLGGWRLRDSNDRVILGKRWDASFDEIHEYITRYREGK